MDFYGLQQLRPGGTTNVSGPNMCEVGFYLTGLIVALIAAFIFTLAPPRTEPEPDLCFIRGLIERKIFNKGVYLGIKVVFFFWLCFGYWF